MSKVYSFRLDENNPREAQAREVIEAWVGDGYSLRHIVTDALIFYCDKESGSDGVYSLLMQIKDMISTLDTLSGFDKSESQKQTILTQSFTNAVKNSARSGLGEKN